MIGYIIENIRLEMEKERYTSAVRKIDPANVEPKPKLNGIELKRFQARSLIKKYAKVCERLSEFVNTKCLTEKQCHFVFYLVDRHKAMMAERLRRDAK